MNSNFHLTHALSPEDPLFFHLICHPKTLTSSIWTATFIFHWFCYLFWKNNEIWSHLELEIRFSRFLWRYFGSHPKIPFKKGHVLTQWPHIFYILLSPNAKNHALTQWPHIFFILLSPNTPYCQSVSPTPIYRVSKKKCNRAKNRYLCKNQVELSHYWKFL